MNNDTAEVVFDVVERLTKLVADRKAAAVVVFDGDEPAVLTGKSSETDAGDYRYLLMPVRLAG